MLPRPSLQGSRDSRPSAVGSTSAASDREFAYTQKDFERVRRLIHGRTGIALSESKEDMVYSRLARRLRAIGLDDFRDYLDRLESENDEAEWQAFVNALTTNLTAFFRESHHFEELSQQLRRRPKGTDARIWCAAASTGEEPYSLAITAAETYGALDPPVSILATDIDTQVLETARQGVYAMERIERLTTERVRRFFLKGTGEKSGWCRVRPELRDLIQFETLNLLDPRWNLQGPFDAIFCRNVMIYFDKATQRQILQRFLPLLTPNGVLYAGHSESFFHATDLFRSIGRTVYQKANKPTVERKLACTP